MPADASSNARLTITKPIPGTPSRHLPLAEITASMPPFDTSIGNAPNELIASTIRRLSCRAHSAAISSSGFSNPALVSRCTCATCVMRGSRRNISSMRATLAGSSSRNFSSTDATPSRSRIFSKRVQYAPLFGTSTTASRGTSEPSAASTENVPLPCIGTHTKSSSPDTIASRSRQISLVIRLKAASHDPQSRSIASRVAGEVVSGPGVSNIGSLPVITISLHSIFKCLDARGRPEIV